jgi:hypothetical protein
VLGKEQSIMRAAMCVYARWRAQKWEGTHNAYCCFADCRHLGVSRVRIDSNRKVSFEVFEPIPLPGYDGCTDPKALRIMKYLLTAKEADLEHIMSPPMEIFEWSGQVKGDVACWSLGVYLGAGGFAVVYADRNDASRVIKIVRSSNSNEQHNTKLQTELDILKIMREKGGASSISIHLHLHLPVVMDTLSLANNMIALKFSPRGIPVMKYLRAMDDEGTAAGTIYNRLGEAVVDTLQWAHTTALVAHRDVRAANLLLIPSGEEMARIVAAAGDIVEGAALRSIEVAKCAFQLNDWGEAIQLSTLDETHRKTCAVSDLKSLAEALLQLHWHWPDTSDCGGTESCSTSYRAVEESAVHAQLVQCASEGDYSGCKGALNGLTDGNYSKRQKLS